MGVNWNEISVIGVLGVAIGLLGLSLWGALGIIERMHHRRGRHERDDYE